MDKIEVELRKFTVSPSLPAEKPYNKETGECSLADVSVTINDATLEPVGFKYLCFQKDANIVIFKLVKELEKARHMLKVINIIDEGVVAKATKIIEE